MESQKPQHQVAHASPKPKPNPSLGPEPPLYQPTSALPEKQAIRQMLACLRSHGEVSSSSSQKTLKRPGGTPRTSLSYDMITDVLSRLPVKCFMRLRCVCKQWYLLRDRRHFINLHASRGRREESIIYLDDYGRGEDFKFYLRNLDCEGDLNYEVSLVPLKRRLLKWDISNSVDGLICVYKSNVVHLLNPATRESVVLPQPPGDNRIHCLGLAFDPRTSAYKVVARLYSESECSGYSCNLAVLTVGSPTWRFTGETSGGSQNLLPVFFHGDLHWIDEFPSDDTVLSFNVEDEKIVMKPVPAPVPAANSNNSPGGLIASLEGCLCYASFDYGRENLDLWLLQENRTWTKRYSITTEFMLYFPTATVTGMLSNGNILIRAPLTRYDAERGTFRVLDRNAHGSCVVYTESLVSPMIEAGSVVPSSKF